MAKNDFQYGGWNSYTLQCGMITSLISPGDCTLQCGMWLGEPGNMTVNSPSGSTLQCNMWLWDNMLSTSPGCSTLQCVRWLWDDMPNVRHIGILHLVSISTISPQSTCHFATVCEILFKSDHPRQKKNDVMSIFKMADLSHLGFWGSNNAFLVKSMYDFLWVVSRHDSSKLHSF